MAEVAACIQLVRAGTCGLCNCAACSAARLPGMAINYTTEFCALHVNAVCGVRDDSLNAVLHLVANLSTQQLVTHPHMLVV